MKVFVISLALILSISIWGCDDSNSASKRMTLESTSDSISYALGLDLALGYMDREKLTISKDQMYGGAKDAFAGTANMTRVEAANYRRKLGPLLAKRKVGEELTGLDMDRYSYAEGVLIGSDLQEMKVEFDVDAFKEGISDGQSELIPQLNEAQRGKYVKMLYSQMSNAMQFLVAEKKMKSETQDAAFIAATEKEEGVVKLSSGLMYKIITPGQGASPKATDQVEVHYEGRLVSGLIFDSSYERGETASFAVNRVIPGWTEALQLMKPGAKWQLYIPPHLAYGEKGSGNLIGPNATLVFDVEYIALKVVEKKE